MACRQGPKGRVTRTHVVFCTTSEDGGGLATPPLRRQFQHNKPFLRKPLAGKHCAAAISDLQAGHVNAQPLLRSSSHLPCGLAQRLGQRSQRATAIPREVPPVSRCWFCARHGTHGTVEGPAYTTLLHSIPPVRRPRPREPHVPFSPDARCSQGGAGFCLHCAPFVAIPLGSQPQVLPAARQSDEMGVGAGVGARLQHRPGALEAPAARSAPRPRPHHASVDAATTGCRRHA